jgi:predicted nucleotidyltransferase
MNAHGGPPAPVLASIRSRWLDAATASLGADPAVSGTALVGSLGSGRADDWSDIDLLTVVADAALDEFTDATRLAGVPGTLAFTSDARHNALRGARAVGAAYVIDGLPLRVDLYVYPVSWAAWPADSTVLFDRRGLPRLALTFAEYLDTAEHEEAVPKSPAERAALRTALIPIAAKWIARRSPDTARMIELVGGPAAAEGTWADYLTILRDLLGQHPATEDPALIAATHAYLDLVSETLG